MTSAFIIVVHSEFRPDRNEETTALLRVIIHTLDNTTFGGQVPSVPQWAGPPHRIIQVQSILFASLSASLLSALLAMLGKQWLNRCMPIDMRGTIIQRSQYRQRKLDGIVSWYFHYVMESLSVMLQAALLLLGCALSRYLWEINTTVASVVLGVTTLGSLFYLFILVAGAVSKNCPYQTPGANIIRHIPDAISRVPILLLRVQDAVFRFVRVLLHRIPHILHHVRGTLSRVPNILRHPLLISDVPHLDLSAAIEGSWFCTMLVEIQPEFRAAQRTLRGIAAMVFHLLLVHVFLLPAWLIADVCRLAIWLSVGFVRRVNRARVEPHAEQTTEQRMVTHIMDLRCVLWTLQTSVDGPARWSALDYLATMALDDFNPIQFVGGWFNIFLICIQVTDGNAMIIQGFEWLAERSSLFCLHMLSHLVVADPMSGALEGVRQQYARVFPPRTNFHDLPASHNLGIIHNILYSNPTEDLGNALLAEGPIRPLFVARPPRWRVQWNDYRPSGSEHTTIARALTRFAQFEYKKSGQHAKVPRWLLRFALHSLSQNPLPPPSVILDSLSIVAIDLGCTVPKAITVEPPTRGEFVLSG